MRNILLIAGLIAVAACEGAPAQTGPTLGQIEQECGYGRRQFVEAWPCVRVGFAGAQVEPDLLAQYLATGDYVAEQAREGKLTEAGARMAMSDAYARASTESIRRNQADRAIAAQRAAAMAGIVAANQRPAPQPVYRQPITCNRYGNQVTCY